MRTEIRNDMTEDAREKKIQELLATDVSEDAKLPEIKAKNAEIASKQRQVTTLLLKNQRVLMNNNRKFKVAEVTKRSMVNTANDMRNSRDRWNAKDVDHHIRELILQDEETKTIYTDIEESETRVKELDTIFKLNKLVAERLDSMENAEINIIKMKARENK